MLRAEQAALEQHGRAELLRILDREFEYYKNSYDAVGTQAALIAGFIVAVLVTLDTRSVLALFERICSLNHIAFIPHAHYGHAVQAVMPCLPR